jgi:hypothetical protein
MRLIPRPAILPALLLVAGLGACAHSESVPSAPPDNPPFGAGSWPRPITFNMFDDRQPSWLPDGSGILYSTQRENLLTDNDRCIALLPALGGSQLWRRCETDLRHAADTTDVWEWPTAGPGGRTYFVRTTAWNRALKYGYPRMEIVHNYDFEHGHTLRTLPFITGSGRQELATWTPRWLTPDKIAYLGVLEFWEGESFAPDTFFTGQEVMLLQLAGDSAVSFAVVPGTDFASSVSADPAVDPDAIYYTLGGDSIVYRRHLTSGVVDTVHNFGAGRVVRDVSVRGNTLAAIIGDSIIWVDDTVHDWTQRDEGGDIVVVDLVTGNETLYSRAPVWLFRHPEISPDGKLLVVEVQPFAYPVGGPEIDYDAINHRADLWLFSLEEPPLHP